ncbi:protein prenylyltransferase [Clathrospora elynae]|uniref:Protein prenylyltransferase n=1 Tax=Clathrospora elynae TaxID=706981 RepID=A0A6A5SHR4_9PLEO|nr:protein prenylyltransferase [Clathrospora elynae]
MLSTSPDIAKLQKLAYKRLSEYFQEHAEDVITIEILPPAIQPPDGVLMQDGLNLGVPKKILALAYMEARQRFFDNIKNGTTSSTALQATNIMLLFDPEHLTAANFRKRRLLQLKNDTSLQAGSAYHKALRRELNFLNTILTSPLHRQSKSPTLWYQRLWILGPLVDIELKNASKNERAVFWRGELTAVCKSGEQHPKNYYAWQYARRLIPRIESPEISNEFAYDVKDWCRKHPSDISGWTFLLFLLPGMQPVSEKQNLLGDVLRYAITFTSEQESLWVFIRMALARETLCGGNTATYQTLQDHGKALGVIHEHRALSERVSQTLTWIDTYGQPVTVAESSCSKEYGWC